MAENTLSFSLTLVNLLLDFILPQFLVPHQSSLMPYSAAPCPHLLLPPLPYSILETLTSSD